MTAFVLLSPMDSSTQRPPSPFGGSDRSFSPMGDEKVDWGDRVMGGGRRVLGFVPRRRLLWIVPTTCVCLALFALAHAVQPGRRPLTPLGLLAEEVYRNVGSTRAAQYRADLRRFYTDYLAHPSHPAPSREKLLPMTLLNSIADNSPIPHLIHQTNRNGLNRSEVLQIWAPKSWQTLNKDYTYTLSDDAAADEWVREQFPAKPMQKLWADLAEVPVMRTDLWRYLRLVRLGGVYSDMDTRCLQPIDRWDVWHGSPAGGEHESQWMLPPLRRPKPRIIVGIEADVGNRSDWSLWWPRPIQLVQWTIASSAQHPILIDTIRRIAMSSSQGVKKLMTVVDTSTTQDGVDQIRTTTPKKMSAAEEIMRVVKITGPGPFTDSVLRYIGAVSGGKLDWRALRQVPAHGFRVMDLLILPISAFSPGIQSMGAQEIDYEGAYVHHGFAGTWKPMTDQ